MKHYYYIADSIYWYDSVSSYMALASLTKDFTDYSKLEDLDNEVFGLFLDMKVTRYIINQRAYVVVKNFINIDTKEHFIIFTPE